MFIANRTLPEFADGGGARNAERLVLTTRVVLVAQEKSLIIVDRVST